jgi:hypothetical protein
MNVASLKMGSVILALSLCAVSARGDVVIGNFEGAAEAGWGEWNGGVQPFTSIISVSNEAATLGTGSVKIVQAGWDQNLAFSADGPTRAAFMAHDQLMFDVIYPATTTSGWAQIFDVAINSQYGGFVGTSFSGDGAGWGSTGGGSITKTYTYDYSSGSGATNHKADWLANGAPGWIELIFATNNDGVHDTFYVDNVRLVSVPEPASLGAIAIGATLLGRRRRD